MAALRTDTPRAETGRPGTRFRLFPSAPYASKAARPVTVALSPPAGRLAPGPADPRMRVVRPVGKRSPYGIVPGPLGTPHLYLPPWRGPELPAVRPGPGGHFDHLEPGTPDFAAAHLYGSVRFGLDVWERCFGRTIPWHSARDRPRIELLALPGYDNAQAGYGFIEAGEDRGDGGGARPFGLSFDVIVHELGHLILYSVLGVPDPDRAPGETFGFHESAADLASLVALLHFEPVLDGLLAATRGNLYTPNELNRFAELSEAEQIRSASNGAKLADFAKGWDSEHALSQPLTGAVFDILVDVFQERLLARGLIDRETVALLERFTRARAPEPPVQQAFDRAYAGRHASFRQALAEARDVIGRLLAGAWDGLGTPHPDYAGTARALLAADRRAFGGRYRGLIEDNVRWRGIGTVRAGPRLPGARPGSHARSARTLLPGHADTLPTPAYRERWLLAREGRGASV